ncbi:hypothetical protein PM082_015672 [Marasmius tenuissimus]|nr:hypothetical protein PM082_015672 [Marasmius tenuissimus]
MTINSQKNGYPSYTIPPPNMRLMDVKPKPRGELSVPVTSSPAAPPSASHTQTPPLAPPQNQGIVPGSTSVPVHGFGPWQGYPQPPPPPTFPPPSSPYSNPYGPGSYYYPPPPPPPAYHSYYRNHDSPSPRQRGRYHPYSPTRRSPAPPSREYGHQPAPSSDPIEELDDDASYPHIQDYLPTLDSGSRGANGRHHFAAYTQDLIEAKYFTISDVALLHHSELLRICPDMAPGTASKLLAAVTSDVNRIQKEIKKQAREDSGRRYEPTPGSSRDRF